MPWPSYCFATFDGFIYNKETPDLNYISVSMKMCVLTWDYNVYSLC